MGSTSYFALELEPNIDYRFFGDVGNSFPHNFGLRLLNRHGTSSQSSSDDWQLGSSAYLDYSPEVDELPMTLLVLSGEFNMEYLLTGMRWPPSAILETDSYSGELPFTITLDASRSSDAEGKEIARYEFDFGDGAGFVDNGTNPIIGHTYVVEGLYYPKVQVIDDEGNFDIGVVVVYAGQEYDEWEINERQENSQHIDLPVNGFRGSCGQRYDGNTGEYEYQGYDGEYQDYFDFSADTGEVVHLTLDYDFSTGNLDLYLVNELGTILAVSDSDGNTEELFYTVLPEDPGILYVLIWLKDRGDYSDYLLNAEILTP